MRLHYDRVERRHSEDGFRLIGGALIPEGGPTLVTQFNEAWTEALALHVADAVTLGPLTLTPGVRIEAMRSAFVNRATGETRRRLAQVFLPGLGVFYALTDKLGALAGVYRGFSPTEPGAEQRIKPELSVNYEAGARYSDRRWRAEVIGYYNDYSNITNICTLSSGCSEANLDRQFDGGKARIYGLEAFAEIAPVVGDVSIPIIVAYTATKSEFLNTFRSEDPIFSNVAAGDEMPYVPRHQATISAGVDGRYGGGAVSGNYVSAMREEPGSQPLSNALSTDEQVTIDVAANCRLLQPLTLYVNVRNLLNEQFIISHRPFGARPNAPRWVQVGLKASF
jgi:Fe(3+) dicitrate transport protein